jgi:hypothetical protein
VAWILGAGVCVLAIGFFYLKTRHATKVEENIQPVPLTAYPGDVLFPAFSPDGSQIVFAWSGDPESGPKGEDLYVKVIGTENLLRLTHQSHAGPASGAIPSLVALHARRIFGTDHILGIRHHRQKQDCAQCRQPSQKSSQKCSPSNIHRNPPHKKVATIARNSIPTQGVSVRDKGSVASDNCVRLPPFKYPCYYSTPFKSLIFVSKSADCTSAKIIL